MKIGSVIALTALISQIVAPTLNASATPLTGADKVKSIVTSTKESTLVLGYSNEQAYQQLVNSLKDQHITSTDMISYVTQYGSADERNVFNAALSAGLSSSPDQLASVLNRVGSQNVQKGANFKISCAAGLGIGIPLALAGIIVGIVYLVNKNLPDQTKSNYLDQRNTATQNYLTAKGKLDVSLASANQQIAVDKTQIEYLNSQIKSGYYGQDDIQKFKAQIANYETDIAAQTNLAGGTNASETVLTAQYNAQMQNLSDKEAADIKTQNDQNGVLPYVAVPALLIGIPFTVAGAIAGAGNDCEN